MTATTHRHLLGLDGQPAVLIESLLDRADALAPLVMKPGSPRDTLLHQTIGNVFFENSTRTRCSFEIAARKLGGNVIDISAPISSVKKGETLLDTCRNLQAMGVNGFVIRTDAPGGPHHVAERLGSPVINAGDGSHEHPTQGLLDLLTLRQRWGSLDGKTVAIVGDITHSRVARSAMFGLTTLGANVVFVGPPRLAPRTFEQLGLSPGTVRVERDFDAVIPTVDAIMMLRVQFERDAGAAIASVNEYRQRFGLNLERMNRMKPDALVMHPGPINRGLELDSAVADHPERSVIMNQVTNGVAVRMAALEWAMSG